MIVLSPRERALWGSSNEWSRKITSASARRSSDKTASKIAAAFLDEIAASKSTTRELFHGTTLPAAKARRLAPGDWLDLPLTALSDDEDFARSFAEGSGVAALFRFARGIRAMRYSDVEWITAGDFRVEDVAEARDPFWQTRLLVVSLRST